MTNGREERIQREVEQRQLSEETNRALAQLTKELRETKEQQKKQNQLEQQGRRRVAQQEDITRRSAARWGVAEAGARAGQTGFNIYAQRRGWIQQATNITMLNRIARVVVPMVIGGLAFRAARGRLIAASGGQVGAQGGVVRQQMLLAELVRESKQTRISIENIEARTMAGRDILGGGVAFQRMRMEALGLGVTPLQARGALARGAAGQMLEQAQGARRRATGAVFAEPQALLTVMRAGFNRIAANVSESILSFAGISSVQGRGLGRTAERMALGQMDIAGGGVAGSIARMARERGIGGGIFGQLEDAAGRQGRQAESRRLTLATLMRRGPAQILQPAPTGRAGTQAEYQLRVQMQRQAMQSAENVRWQNEVLELLRRMVNLGEADRATLEAFGISTGRNVGTGGEVD